MQKITSSPIPQNDYLAAMARQLYDYWFVQFDFPDENGRPYKSSGGKMVWNEQLKREIPEGWKVARLSDYIEEHISGDWGNDNPTDGCMQVSCIRGADMKTMEDLPIRFIPTSHTDRLLHVGDIVIEMSGGSPTQSTGRSVCVTSKLIEDYKGCLVCSNFCHALVIKNPYKYYFHYLWQKLYENGVMFNFEGKTSGLRNLQLDSLCSSYWSFPATEEDWGTEYLDYIISIKIVHGLDEAIAHINRYGTGHSEAIITNDYHNAQKFLDEVDAAAVYVNASTRFTAGNEFGFGAEIGISTQKLHARGPMGLPALTTTKFIIYGDGQIRK